MNTNNVIAEIGRRGWVAAHVGQQLWIVEGRSP